MTTTERKKWIDTASYAQLLSKWRFEPIGSPWFAGEVGKYFADKISAKRNAGPDEAIRASKSLGWKTP
jgi:hypothetical protein